MTLYITSYGNTNIVYDNVVSIDVYGTLVCITQLIEWRGYIDTRIKHVEHIVSL